MNAVDPSLGHHLYMGAMKYPGMPGGANMAVSGNGSHIDEVDSLFSSPCWSNSNINNLPSEYIDAQSIGLDGSINHLETDKLLLGSPISHHENDIEAGDLDNYFSNSQTNNSSLAELKPLPSFAGFSHVVGNINAIHQAHYKLIEEPIPEENNNSYNNYHEHIVSSSTCNVSADSAGDCERTMYEEMKVNTYADCANPDSVSSVKMYEDGSHASADSVTQIKTEMGDYDLTGPINLDYIIGSAIADTTVSNTNQEGSPGSPTYWFEDLMSDACSDQKNLSLAHDGLQEFGINCNNTEYTKQQLASPQGTSTLQTLLTQGYNMPMLQNRLQNGPPIKQEVPSSTNYDLISASSPPANVVSTTDTILLNVNGRFMQHYNVHGLDQDHRIRSPDLMGQNYPHTTTANTPNTPKKSRSRAQKKQAQQQATSTVFQSDQSLSHLGKEKPVHRCNICNRGFLNKSNIKVHLRTHTGEKPFRCETCAKAFRQKAHLLKHQQIHKRIGRD